MSIATQPVVPCQVVTGRLDAHRVPDLAEQLSAIGPGPLSLDLGQTTFIDLMGLELLTEVAAGCRAAARHFEITALSPPARIILELVGSTDLLEAAGLGTTSQCRTKR